MMTNHYTIQCNKTNANPKRKPQTQTPNANPKRKPQTQTPGGGKGEPGFPLVFPILPAI